MHSYYVVMMDYGRHGFEAVVDPEITRLGVIDRIQRGDYKNIVFIHHISGLQNLPEDVTDELINTAKALEYA